MTSWLAHPNISHQILVNINENISLQTNEVMPMLQGDLPMGKNNKLIRCIAEITFFEYLDLRDNNNPAYIILRH